MIVFRTRTNRTNHTASASQPAAPGVVLSKKASVIRVLNMRPGRLTACHLSLVAVVKSLMSLKGVSGSAKSGR